MHYQHPQPTPAQVPPPPPPPANHHQHPHSQVQANQHQQQITNDAYSIQSQVAGGAAGGQPLIAKGNWTKDLIRLAKTAELKKHSLELQVQTAQIITFHQELETKDKALQDVKEKKNRLEGERARMLENLRKVNEERDRADMEESNISKDCMNLRNKIQIITDGEYAEARRMVDALRTELGQPPAPSLQQSLEEKNAAYLNERRLNGAPSAGTEAAASSSTSLKRPASEVNNTPESTGKRPRGRPKGSKNRAKVPPSSSGTTSTAGPTE